MEGSPVSCSLQPRLIKWFIVQILSVQTEHWGKGAFLFEKGPIHCEKAQTGWKRDLTEQKSPNFTRKGNGESFVKKETKHLSTPF